MAAAPPLGAFVPGDPVELEPTGSGPLDGLTFAVKDVFDVAGHRTGFGSPTWRETHGPAGSTAPAVAGLLAAGARLVGKTISDELTYSLTGENVHYGTPLNSRAPERVPGGSSSGSASAVAGGACDFALGTDCAGSVRIPASYCGILGMRPTHGRVSLAGVHPFAPTFDTGGWFARDPDVLERAGHSLLAGAGGGGVQPERLLVASDAFELVGKETAEALAPAVERAAAAIGVRAELTVSPDGLAAWAETFRIVQGFEIWRSLGPWIQEAKPELGPGIRERAEAASRIGEAEAAAARRGHERIRVHLEGLLGPGDVLCLPTAPGAAPLRGAGGDEVEIARRSQAISLLCIAGHGGLPQLSLPLAEVDECPLGLSLVGPRGADEALLALAARLA